MLLGLLAAAPPGTDAATLVVEPYYASGTDTKILRYSGSGDEQNRLVVTEDASYVTFSDPGAVIEPGACDSTGPVAICRKEGLPKPVILELDLGDGNDSARADISADGAFHNPDVPWLPSVRMLGGAGSDELVGSDLPSDLANSDWLNGGGDSDRLVGRGGSDSLDGGAGSDHMEGGAGYDMLQGRGIGARAADDADTLLGGDGGDQVNYGYQNDPPPELGDSNGAIRADLRVTGDGQANDGAAGEGDDVGAGIEAVYLGGGNDYAMTGGDLRGAHGGPGNDELHAGNSTWPGGFGLQGGSGDDVLMGSSDRDALSGHEGNDRIVGGAGNDSISGDEGDDWIDARDPPRPAEWTAENDGHDWVMCGTGQDEIYPDESEIRSMAPGDGCEIVHAPPASGPPPPPPTAVPPAIPSLGGSGTASAERVTVLVKCSRGTGECRGELVLTAPSAKAGATKARTKTVVIARGKVAANPGKSRRVSVPLTKAGRNVLRRRSRVEARASLKPQAKGAKTVSARMVVKRRR